MAKAVLQATPAEIPDKLYFRIGEVSRLTGIKPYVLRYWESEFPMLSPKKSGTNHRLYRRKDVELIFEIKTLLYEMRYTIEGARNYLENRRLSPTEAKAEVQRSSGTAASSPMEQIRRELREILGMLD
jgi:Predicted transcriptional regulators